MFSAALCKDTFMLSFQLKYNNSLSPDAEHKRKNNPNPVSTRAVETPETVCEMPALESKTKAKSSCEAVKPQF